MLLTGQMVIVMYPYDVNWWKTEGYVIGYDGDNQYRVEDLDGNKIAVDIGFLKH